MSTLFSDRRVTQSPLLGQLGRSPAPSWLGTHAGLLMTASLGAALLWSYLPILETMADRFWHDPQYSHGFLVPIFALLVLWLRRDLWQGQLEPSVWGVPLLVCGVAIRLIWSRMEIEALDAFSLLPTLAGVVALVGGRQLLRWSWPAIAYLAFMLPLPFFIEQGLSQPLRRLATVMSTYLLETMGYPAVADGNVIMLDDIPLKVAEACSGLGMLMTFFALSTACAMLMRPGWIDKAVIIVSAIPIAVLANVIRITATGAAFVSFGPEIGKLIIHDLAGWLMMLLAVLMLVFELWLLDRLFPRMGAAAPLMIPGLKTTAKR